MPAIPAREGLPFAYLDWSTLVYAFDGTRLDAGSEYRELSALVWELAARTNLCLSLTHLFELLHRSRLDERMAMARWLDELPVVFLRSEEEVEEAEVRQLLLGTLKQGSTPPPIPTAPAFLSLFKRWRNLNDLASALRTPTITAFVEEAGQSPENLAGIEKIRQLSVRRARRLYVDRGLALQQTDEKGIRAGISQKATAALEEDALALARQLRADPHSDFYFTGSSGVAVPPDDAWVVAVVRSADPKALPFRYLSQRVVANMSFEIVERQNVRTAAFDRQRSDYYDELHLIGAAYCDLFTCDATVARRLERGREALGFFQPITGAGGVASLTRSLRGQVGEMLEVAKTGRA